MTEPVYGGFCVLTVGQIANICALKQKKLLSGLGLRLYLAAHEEKAKRCVRNAKQAQYRLDSLSGLLGTETHENRIKAALNELRRLSLLSWEENCLVFSTSLNDQASETLTAIDSHPDRPVPIPRRFLRALIKHSKPGEIIAALAHCVRCLFKKGSRVTSNGLCKAGWVAETFGVSLRTVRNARKWLLSLGILVRQDVHQFVLNRYGGCFNIALTWGGQGRKKRPSKPNFAPPYNNKLNSKELINNQYEYSYRNPKNRTAFRQRSGFLRKRSSGPTIRDIQENDLTRISSLLCLYKQATQAGWLSASEANKVNFIASAVRSTQVNGDPVRVFVGIVKKGLFHFITHGQEAKAVNALKRYQAKQRKPRASAEPTNGRGKGSSLEKLLEQTVSGLSKVGPGWKHEIGSEQPVLHLSRKDEKCRKVWRTENKNTVGPILEYIAS